MEDKDKDEYPKDLIRGTRAEFIFNVRRERKARERRRSIVTLIALLAILAGCLMLYITYGPK